MYTEVKDKSKKMEFFKKNNALWMKNEVYGMSFTYTGNNSFEYPGMPEGTYAKLHFEILSSGDVQVTLSYADDDKVKHTTVSVKQK